MTNEEKVKCYRILNNQITVVLMANEEALAQGKEWGAKHQEIFRKLNYLSNVGTLLAMNFDRACEITCAGIIGVGPKFYCRVKRVLFHTPPEQPGGDWVLEIIDLNTNQLHKIHVSHIRELNNDIPQPVVS